MTSVKPRSNGRKYKVRQYEFDSSYVNGLKIIDYVPVCVYLSSKYIRNFKILGACLCVKETEIGGTSTIIVKNLLS